MVGGTACRTDGLTSAPMKLTICAVGRAKPSPEKDLTANYLDRISAIGRPVGITSAELIEVEERKRLSPPELKKREGELLLKAVPEGAALIVLDERGRSLSSEELADHIAKLRDDGAPTLACLIGGADGLAPEVGERASLSLAFGRATWPHMLVRVLLAEQLYRAVTIMTGHPYHRSG